VSKPVLIGDFLHRIKRPIDLDPASHYRLVTVRLKHKGVVLRGEKLGADIKSKMYQVKEGDFILSGIDARNGAFGIVPPELDGAIVTNDFWYFEIDDEIVDKSFFLELTTTRWFDEICRKGSDGTTQRIRLQKGKFFNQTIYLPDLPEQRLFNKRFQAVKASNNTLSCELTHQKNLIKKLRQQVLEEAIEGKLTADWRAQNPDVEPASELLKRIAAEKSQLVKDKKIKAQKPLPPITDEEKPFELPQGWEWSKIGKMTSVVTSGSRNWQSLYSDTGATFIRSQDIKLDRLSYANRAFVDISRAKEGKRTLVNQHDWLIIITGANVGKCAYLQDSIEEAYVSQHVALMRPMQKEIGIFGHYWLTAELGGRGLLSGFIYGDKPGLNLPQLRNLLIPIPPMKEQGAIVAKIEELLALCDQLETQITQNQSHAEQLMQAVLKEAFSHTREKVGSVSVQPPDNIIPFKPKGADYYKRTLLAAEIVYQLYKEPTLGHLKLQKLIYLCQKTETMQLPTQFLKQVAGPYDPTMARSIDKQLKDKKWFSYNREETPKYETLVKAGEHQADFDKYFAQQKDGIHALIRLFRKAKSDQLEIVATLYACWESILKKQEPLSEDLLVQRFYEWSEEKSKYEASRIHKAIAWMRNKDIVPDPEQIAHA
jgi:restriction endonuclease S subunit/uncharacterized protein YwgA